MDVEAVGKGQSGARLQIRLDLRLVDGGLILVRQQDHHHIRFGGGVGHGLDLQALLLGVFHGLGGRTQADDHVDTGVTQVQRMGVALGTVTDNGHLLAIEHGQIGVLFVPDSCCHDWRSFYVFRDCGMESLPGLFAMFFCCSVVAAACDS